ncbi:unnamed protein product, partial [Rotaria sordida]
MEYSCVQLTDLPDEILITIFKKLANIEVLYSIVGVNKRLNKIAYDFVFTNNLALLMSTLDGFVYSLHDPILDRFCLHILPEIHQKIKWLELESQSMEHILLATNYPNLCGISLYNIEPEKAIDLFTEVLDLCLIVEGRKIFVDGNDLKMNIINHMPRLNKFIFNIRSWNCFYNEINFPSNENIQNTFKDFKDKQIICCTDYCPKEKKSQCHIYSYPYKVKHYDDITNSFPGGTFKYVRKVSLFDEHPFEHEFFLQIAQSFPLMKDLSITNQKRQINNQFKKSMNLSIIKYPHLKYLCLVDTCIDYHEQFLLDIKTCLPLDVSARMDYKLVKKVTRNFRRNTTR